MKKSVKALVSGSPEFGYSASLEIIKGVITEGETLTELEANLHDALEATLEVYKEEGFKIPNELKGEIEFNFVITPAVLFEIADVLKSSAVAKRSGVNVQLLSHYLTGTKKPSVKQMEKIENTLHEIGRELQQVSLSV